MSQRVTFKYATLDSTADWNSRFVNILAPGPYKGLLCKATAVPSLKVDITAGDLLTTEGVKVEESADILEAVELLPGHTSRDRIDLICLYHEYLLGTLGVPLPQGNPATYVVVPGEVPADDLTPPEAPYANLTSHHHVLCEAHVPAGATYITDSMLQNLRRVPTTVVLEDNLAEVIYYTWGNFSYYGWEVTQAGVVNLNVSPGKGMLCGRVNTSLEDYLITGMRLSEMLRPANDPNTGTPYEVGQNLSLLEQPDFPTKLAITITTTDTAVAGKIYISGKNELGDQIIDHEVEVSQGANQAVTYFSDVYFAEVFLEGIDAHELVTPGHAVYIKIFDTPVNLILAVGTPTGVPNFRAELNPAYKPKCNEMIIAKVHTDENGIIEIEPINLNPMADWVDNLTPQCDGVRKIFYASANAIPNTDSLWNDGARIWRDDSVDWSETSGKGYKLNGREIELGPNIPAPDANTVLRFAFKRLG